jgi:Ca2+-transporting ATPase
LDLFKYYLSYDNIIYAETIAFSVLVIFQMFFVFSLRSETTSIFMINPFTNIKLIMAVILSIALQFAVVYVPFLQKSFETVALNLKDWILVFGVGSSIMLYSEIVKIYKRVSVKNAS